MKGFTIKCNNCDMEQKLVIKESFSEGNISIYPDIIHDLELHPAINIECDCRNEIYETKS